MRINWWRLVLFIIAFYNQNKYFGWNQSPQSPLELIADTLCILLLALSFDHKPLPATTTINIRGHMKWE